MPAKKPAKKAAPTTKKKAAPKQVKAKPVPVDPVTTSVTAAVETRDFKSFAVSGEPCKPDDKLCAAMTNEKGHYFLRFDGGRLFEVDAGMRFDLCGFRRVNERAWTAYVEYLKNKNPSYLRLADRAVVNDPTSFLG